MKTARDYRVTLSLEVVNRYEHYLLNTAGEGEGGGGGWQRRRRAVSARCCWIHSI